MFYRSCSLDRCQTLACSNARFAWPFSPCFARWPLCVRVCVWEEKRLFRIHSFQHIFFASLFRQLLESIEHIFCECVCVCVVAFMYRYLRINAMNDCNWAHIGMCFELIFVVVVNGMRRPRRKNDNNDKTKNKKKLKKKWKKRNI